MPTAINYLFVYGTLMQDFKNEMSQFLASHSQFIAHGYFTGKLYEVDGFPGAIPSDDEHEKVYGSVFKLHDNNKVFEVLDAYEGIDKTSSEPDLYNRLLVDVSLDNKESLSCWVYMYNFSVDSLKQIPSGRYKSSI